MEKEHYGATG